MFNITNHQGNANQIWAGGMPHHVVKNPPAMQEPQEIKIRSLHQEDPLKEGTATHSSILTWRIPWTEEPGVLQPIRLQIVNTFQLDTTEAT